MLAALEKLIQPARLLLIDGYVWLPGGQPGLGVYLWEAMGKTVPVVGVAKSPWREHDGALPVLRGGSRRPLWVSSQGLDLEEAARRVQGMHGEHRLPTMLKLADTICRTSRHQ